MNTNKNIYWSDGLFLKPHHFQFIDKNINDNFSFLLDKIYPNNYGFIDYKIDNISLNEGILSLVSCELFINNSLINFPVNSNIITRDISTEINNDKVKNYYLGVKKIFKDHTNIEIQHIKQLNNKNTRYTNIETEFEKVSNLYNTQDEVDFSYVKYTLQFFSEEEVLSLIDYDLIMLCQIKNKNGEFTIKEDVIPSLLNITADSILFIEINNIFKLIIDSIKQLEEDKLKSQNLIILSNINPLIVDFQLILKRSFIVPYDIFNILQKIISTLIVFTKSYSIDMLLDTKFNLIMYDHKNIFGSFKKLNKELKYIIDEIIDKKIEIQREFIFNFQRLDDKYFIDIPQDFFNKNYIFYIELISENKDKLIEKINYLKVSNNEFIDRIIFSSISDVSFKLQNSSSLNFPISTSSVYIKLNKNTKSWDKIIEAKNIVFYIDNDLIMDANLVLLDDVHDE